MSEPSLSWGRAAKPPRWSGPSRRLVIGVLGALVVLVAGTVAYARITSGEHLGPTTGTEIASALREYSDSLAAHDLDRFGTTIDRARTGFALCQEQLFQEGARTGQRMRGRFVVGRLDTWGGYVRAWADDGTGWERLYFRRDGARWELSEPTPEEIGSENIRTFGAITVSYWDPDADVVDLVGRDVDPVRAFAVAQGGPPPARAFRVRLAPIHSLGPGCGFAGQATTSSYDAATTIIIRELRLAPTYDRLAGSTLRVLEHEALHWIQAEYSRGAMAIMPWWMLEGWPTIRAQPSYASSARSVMCGQSAPTLTELDRGPGQSDPPEAISRDYVTAAGLVDTLEAIKGNDAYWRLVDGFRTETSRDAVFGTIGLTEDTLFEAFKLRLGRC